MAWIKIFQTLINHPKLFKLSEVLKKDIHHTCGLLVFLWCWALDYADDGDLSKYNEEQLYNAVRSNSEITPNLLRSLKEAGFLDDDLKIHDWHDYAGEFLRGRYKKKKKSPSEKGVGSEQVRSSSVVTPRKSREEKSKVDKSNIYNPPTPLKSGDSNILQLTNHQKVINCYLETKNGMPFSLLPKETVASGYRRFGRTAGSLLKDTSNNVDLICNAIRYLPVWAKAKGLDWSLETVSKAIAEPRSFKVQFPKLLENERKLIKTYLYMKGWNENKVKDLDLQKSKHTINLIPVAKEILNSLDNNLDKSISALEKYKSTLKDEQEFNLYFASKWIFENYGG